MLLLERRKEKRLFSYLYHRRHLQYLGRERQEEEDEVDVVDDEGEAAAASRCIKHENWN